MASIIIFVGVLPVVNFYIGVQYERTQAALVVAQNAQIPPPIETVHQLQQQKSASTTVLMR